MADEAEVWYAKAHFKLGEAYRRRELWEKARLEYEKGVRINPHYYEAFNALGEIYLAEGKADRAMEFLKRAAAIRGDDPLVHLNLGRAFLSTRKYAEAAREFALALNGDPDNPEVHYFMGRMRLEKGEYRQAISHLEKALPAKRLRLDAQVSIGLAQTELGMFEGATTTLKGVLREDPMNLAALDSISIAYRRRGMEYEAIKHFRRAVSIKAEGSAATGTHEETAPPSIARKRRLAAMDYPGAQKSIRRPNIRHHK